MGYRINTLPIGCRSRPKICVCAQAVADDVAAGFDGIEHATFMTADGVHHDPDLFNVMAARRVFVSVQVASTGGAAVCPHAEIEDPNPAD